MKRRGAVMIMALICLVLIAAMGGTLLHWATMEHKLLLLRERESQARWLAEAGIALAAARLAADGGYSGETWKVAGDDLPHGEPATVRLHVAAGDGGRRVVKVDTEYPADSDAAVHFSKEVACQRPCEEGA